MLEVVASPPYAAEPHVFALDQASCSLIVWPVRCLRAQATQEEPSLAKVWHHKIYNFRIL